MKSLKEKSIDAIIWNLIEKYGIQLVSLVIGVILARLLTPADYGLIGMISVFFALAMVFVSGGFGKAYIQKKDATDADASTIFFFNLVVSLIFYVLLWVSAPLIADFYEQQLLIDLIRVASVIIIINSFSIIQIAKLTKEVNFKKKSIISLTSTIISGVLGIIAALMNYGVWSLVIQQIAKASVNTMGIWFFYKWRPIMIFSFTSFKELFSYGSWLLLSNIIQTIFNNIYILSIGKFFPVAQLGFYSKAKAYQKMVTVHPSTAISAVSFPIFAKLQNDKVALKNSMKKFMQHLLFFISPIVVVLMVTAKPLFLIVLTEKWVPMVPYFQLLLIGGILYPIQLMNVHVINAQGHSKLIFRISLIKNILRVLNILIMYRFGVIYIIYGEIIVSFLSMFINGYFTNKIINYGMLEQLKDLAITYTISLFIVFVGFFMMRFVNNDYLKIIYGALISGIGYFLLQYIFNELFLKTNFDLILIKFKLKK